MHSEQKLLPRWFDSTNHPEKPGGQAGSLAGPLPAQGSAHPADRRVSSCLRLNPASLSLLQELQPRPCNPSSAYCRQVLPNTPQGFQQTPAPVPPRDKAQGRCSCTLCGRTSIAGETPPVLHSQCNTHLIFTTLSIQCTLQSMGPTPRAI